MTYFKLELSIGITTSRKSWKLKLEPSISITFQWTLEFIWFDLFLVVLLLKQKLKLEFLTTNSSFDLIWFDWFHVSSSCVVETKVEAWIYLATIVSFDLIDFLFVVVLLKQKLKLEFFWALIVSFDLIDFMFLVVVLLKQKLKLELFWQQFQALIWLISCL